MSSVNLGNSGGSSKGAGFGLDLVQIRWQLIRETESLQQISQENNNLKEEVSKLEKILKDLTRPAPAVDKTDGLNRKMFRSFLFSLIRENQEMSKEISSMKVEISEFMANFVSQLSLLFQCNKKYLEINRNHEGRHAELKQEKLQFSLLIEELQKELSTFKVHHSSEVESHEKKSDRLLREKRELREKMTLIEEEKSSLVQELTLLKSEKDLFNESYEKIKESRDYYLKETEILDEKNKQLFEDSSLTQQHIVDHYEKVIVPPFHIILYYYLFL
jgi:chromosome segregation ATPase